MHRNNQLPLLTFIYININAYERHKESKRKQKNYRAKRSKACQQAIEVCHGGQKAIVLDRMEKLVVFNLLVFSMCCVYTCYPILEISQCQQTGNERIGEEIHFNFHMNHEANIKHTHTHTHNAKNVKENSQQHIHTITLIHLPKYLKRENWQHKYKHICTYTPSLTKQTR